MVTADYSLKWRGVGFEHEGCLYVARGIVMAAAELGGSVGLVRYDLQQLGCLPARWYHPSLQGKLSDGISINGPTDSIVGEYQADYENSDGKAFSPLRKTIARIGSNYQFAWWDREKFHYVGVGKIVNKTLTAAWGPPGSIIQYVCYDLSSSEEAVVGEWVDYGRNKSGAELLSPF